MAKFVENLNLGKRVLPRKLYSACLLLHIFQYLFTNNYCLWVALDISINDDRMTLVSLYGPNEDKPGFYCVIQGMIEEINNAHFMW